MSKSNNLSLQEIHLPYLNQESMSSGNDRINRLVIKPATAKLLLKKLGLAVYIQNGSVMTSMYELRNIMNFVCLHPTHSRLAIRSTQAAVWPYRLLMVNFLWETPYKGRNNIKISSHQCLLSCDRSRKPLLLAAL